MMQERKIRLAIFVVIGLLVGGIILDALSPFYCGQFGHCHPCKTHQFHSRWGRFWRPQCIGFFYVERDAAERKCGTQDGERHLRQNNVELIAMKAENERLSKLLKFKELHPKYELMPAKVISRDMGDFKDVILIDKGSDEGLRLNMPVVNASGIIGIIDAVYPHMSKVLLITSSRSSLGGLNLRGDSRAAGIVNGVAGPDLSLEMRNLARNADVLPGDTIVSSGYTGYHPEGLVIGTVKMFRWIREV